MQARSTKINQLLAERLHKKGQKLIQVRLLELRGLGKLLHILHDFGNHLGSGRRNCALFVAKTGMVCGGVPDLRRGLSVPYGAILPGLGWSELWQ